VTGLGPAATDAREAAYAAADVIEFDGKQLRRDIALKVASPLGAQP
jgi:phosphoribosylamine---glycine ligase